MTKDQELLIKILESASPKTEENIKFLQEYFSHFDFMQREASLNQKGKSTSSSSGLQEVKTEDVIMGSNLDGDRKKKKQAPEKKDKKDKKDKSSGSTVPPVQVKKKKKKRSTTAAASSAHVEEPPEGSEPAEEPRAGSAPRSEPEHGALAT